MAVTISAVLGAIVWLSVIFNVANGSPADCTVKVAMELNPNPEPKARVPHRDAWLTQLLELSKTSLHGDSILKHLLGYLFGDASAFKAVDPTLQAVYCNIANQYLLWLEDASQAKLPTRRLIHKLGKIFEQEINRLNIPPPELQRQSGRVASKQEAIPATHSHMDDSLHDFERASDSSMTEQVLDKESMARPASTIALDKEAPVKSDRLPPIKKRLLQKTFEKIDDPRRAKELIAQTEAAASEQPILNSYQFAKLLEKYKDSLLISRGRVMTVEEQKKDGSNQMVDPSYMASLSCDAKNKWIRNVKNGIILQLEQLFDREAKNKETLSDEFGNFAIQFYVSMNQLIRYHILKQSHVVTLQNLFNHLKATDQWKLTEAQAISAQTKFPPKMDSTLLVKAKKLLAHLKSVDEASLGHIINDQFAYDTFAHSISNYLVDFLTNLVYISKKGRGLLDYHGVRIVRILLDQPYLQEATKPILEGNKDMSKKFVNALNIILESYKVQSQKTIFTSTLTEVKVSNAESIETVPQQITSQGSTKIVILTLIPSNIIELLKNIVMAITINYGTVVGKMDVLRLAIPYVSIDTIKRAQTAVDILQAADNSGHAEISLPPLIADGIQNLIKLLFTDETRIQNFRESFPKSQPELLIQLADKIAKANLNRNRNFTLNIEEGRDGHVVLQNLITNLVNVLYLVVNLPQRLFIVREWFSTSALAHYLGDAAAGLILNSALAKDQVHSQSPKTIDAENAPFPTESNNKKAAKQRVSVVLTKEQVISIVAVAQKFAKGEGKEFRGLEKFTSLLLKAISIDPEFLQSLTGIFPSLLHTSTINQFAQLTEHLVGQSLLGDMKGRISMEGFDIENTNLEIVAQSIAGIPPVFSHDLEASDRKNPVSSAGVPYQTADPFVVQNVNASLVESTCIDLINIKRRIISNVQLRFFDQSVGLKVLEQLDELGSLIVEKPVPILEPKSLIKRLNKFQQALIELQGRVIPLSFSISNANAFRQMLHMLPKLVADAASDNVLDDGLAQLLELLRKSMTRTKLYQFLIYFYHTFEGAIDRSVVTLSGGQEVKKEIKVAVKLTGVVIRILSDPKIAQEAINYYIRAISQPQVHNWLNNVAQLLHGVAL